MKKRYKKAFTMIELIVVIVVVGILAALMIPKMNDDKLIRAADQIVSHIQYTQHLAMQDDKFSITNNNWYKQRWQIYFHNKYQGKTMWRYSIFSDKIGGNTANPDVTELAKDPLNPRKLLTGGFPGTVEPNDSRANQKLNLTKTYNIIDITFSNSCQHGNSQRISFDYLGRPILGSLSSLTNPYGTATSSRLIVENCNITLKNKSGNSVVITIAPETGYARITSMK